MSTPSAPIQLRTKTAGMTLDLQAIEHQQPGRPPKRLAALISYPKSGRTWLRFMLNSYLCKAYELETDNVFEAETKLANEFYCAYTHLMSAMVFQKPYWETGPVQLSSSQGFRSVWLTRNIRDTLRSAYFQATRRIKVFSGTPTEFLLDPRFGVVKIATFYTQVYLTRSQFPGMEIIRYEDCKKDPDTTLTRYLTALGICPQPAILAYASEQGSKQNMAELSLTDAYAKTPLAPTNTNDPDSFKVRSDKSPLFTTQELAYIDQVVRAVFPPCQQPLFDNLLGDSNRDDA